MIRIRDIPLPLEHEKTDLIYHAARLLQLRASEIASLEIYRRSLDARKKSDIHWVYTVDVCLRSGERQVLRRNKNPKISKESPERYTIETVNAQRRPVVVGFGPAGMFAALVLAMAGAKPIVLERGDSAPVRREKVERFWRTGELDENSNVQFGEGGAGTFSDGKLNTGTKNERHRWILRQFVAAGAPEEILYDAKPHMGTDVLFYVVQAIRKKILALGGEVRFGARLTGLRSQDGKLTAAEYEQDGKPMVLACQDLILAIGHSARDTLRALEQAGIPMEPKPFSMGVRIEHRQENVDLAQYGMPRGVHLPAADYKLSCHLPDGSSAYTFCMCPGGQVVAAASQRGRVVTNGMSNSARDGENANAALLVTLRPEDFPYGGTLGGLRWQEELEEKAFLLGGGNYRAPAQLVGDFLAHRASSDAGEVKPSYRPGVSFCDLHELFPKSICRTLEQAIAALEQRLSGFSHPQALLTAPETRSSSPVRILRDDSLQSSLLGLYPCGEGAGYAGGILSAATDGMLCAEAVLAKMRCETAQAVVK